MRIQPSRQPFLPPGVDSVVDPNQLHPSLIDLLLGEPLYEETSR